MIVHTMSSHNDKHPSIVEYISMIKKEEGVVLYLKFKTHLKVR